MKDKRFIVTLEERGHGEEPPTPYWVSRETGDVFQLCRIYDPPIENWAVFRLGDNSCFGLANGFNPTWQEAVAGLSPIGNVFKLTIEGLDWKEE